MSREESRGEALKRALKKEKPLQVVGVVHAYAALLAERAGFRALYLSGAGVANAEFGLPDLGITSLNDVAATVEKISAASALPLLVDIDTGWGTAFNIARTIKTMIRAGAGGVHIEDQVAAKRCGHRPNKEIVPTSEMCDRVKAAVDARTDSDFVIMARTDAVASEGLDAGIARAKAYVQAGADMIFAEALTSLEEFQTFCRAVSVPVLANMTEFGKTPLLTREALGEAGVGLILYPLSAFRAMNRAAEKVYAAIRKEGVQSSVLSAMQTREELYEVLHYLEYEKTLDRLFSEEKKP